MSVQTFANTISGQIAAFAVPDPKNVVFVNGHFEVRDGADYVAPPTPTQDQLDATAARSYAKLAALMTMTPAQVQAWVTANVTTLAAAQDAITTLAVAVCVLSRKL